MQLEGMKRTFFHNSVLLSVRLRYVFGHRCDDRYAFLIPVMIPNTRPPAIPQGVESKRYLSQAQPSPPPTINAASRSVAIRTAWPSPAYKGSCEGGMSYPRRRDNAAHNAKTLPMAGAQFNQNHGEIVKPVIRCERARSVEYSSAAHLLEQDLFIHDSILPTILPDRSSTTPDPHNGRAGKITV